jgi:DNA-binding beta-propeller fold protein YncE
MKTKSLSSMIVLLLLTLTVVAAANSSTFAAKYHLKKKIQIGGEGGWDYVMFDPNARRLYVSHSTRVEVVDVEKGKVVGAIEKTNGVHGIALDAEHNHGFTSNGRDSTVTVFDLKTLQSSSQIKVGKNPDAIIYDPFTRRVFTFNGASNDATAIDAGRLKVAGTVALEGRPEFAVSDGRGMIYVNTEDKSEVVAFDARTLTIKHRWSLAPGEEPTGLALDKKNRRLFIGCANEKMIVLNADDGRIVADLPIGKGVDAVAFDAGKNNVYSSNGADGTLTVIHEDTPDKFSVVENAPTQRGARTMTLDEKSGDLYLPTAEFGATPAPTAERPRPRPSIVPGSFVVLIMSAG